MHFVTALRPILRDFLSTIVFISCVWITDDIVLSTVVGVTTGVLQTGWMLARRKPIGLLQWISLALVLTLGGTTILTHNGLFFKLKSSILALILAAVFLRERWLTPYLPPFLTERLDTDTIMRAARVWAGLMVAIALSNALVATFCSNRIWAGFIFSVPALSYIGLLSYQYRQFRPLFRTPPRGDDTPS